jgi:hypothetical protein
LGEELFLLGADWIENYAAAAGGQCLYHDADDAARSRKGVLAKQ